MTGLGLVLLTVGVVGGGSLFAWGLAAGNAWLDLAGGALVILCTLLGLRSPGGGHDGAHAHH
jgi:hypothetical protein